MIKRNIFILLLAPFLSAAQKQTGSNQTGIQWTNLSWEQVKAKAKTEKKYIFLDCHTTWCAPCKKMDKEVFADKGVGIFMTSRFISVRVQMDRTARDANSVKNWYVDADLIKTQYKVTSFPTYLFFSPEGQIVHRSNSYLPAHEFMDLASKATNGKTQFYSMVKQYKEGAKDYETMPYMISVARKMKEYNLAEQLALDYLGYLNTLKEEELYTPEKITFLAASIKSTSSKFFKLFYPNGKKVNQVMKQSGYARRITDSVISREIVNPPLSKLSGSAEPDWQGLQDSIQKRFGDQYAQRIVLWRKARWYDARQNLPEFTRYFIELVNINGVDTSSLEVGDVWLNYVAYNNIFGGHPFILTGSTDTSEINTAIRWMQGVVRRASASSADWHIQTIDTYAMLLYKAGRKKEAIAWEEKALQIAVALNATGDQDDFKSKIDKMYKNEPTWRTN